MSYEPPVTNGDGGEAVRITPTIIQPDHPLSFDNRTTLNPLTSSTINSHENSAPIISQPVPSIPVSYPMPQASIPQHSQPQPQSQGQPGNNGVHTPHQWSTPLFDCLKDEESCWWSFWCCWVVAARNTAEFQLGSAKKQIACCVGVFLLAWLLIILKLGPLGPLLLIGAAVYYVFFRTNNRQLMKSQLHILSGEWMSDCLLHFCCTCCTVAQEARESLFATRNKRLDYCSDQELAELAPSADNGLFEEGTAMDTLSSHNPNTNNTTTQRGGGGSLFQSIYFKHLSHTSQNVLIGLALFSLVIVILLLIANPLACLVLNLIFLQPIFVLYLIYWRSEKRRKVVQVDYVVKLFCVGFFLSTSQSVVLETVLQQILTFLGILLFFLIHGPTSGGEGLSDDQMSAHDDKSSASASLLSGHPLAALLEKIVTRRGSFLYQTDYQSFSPEFHPLYHSLSHLSSDYHDPYLLSSYEGMVGLAGGSSPSAAPSLAPSSATDLNGVSKEMLRENILLVLFMLLLMAFVVAAGVEETMKHFAIRCCRFPSPLKDPNVLLVYLVSAALGFATAENIEYVFGVHQSPIPGTSRFVGELVILGMRLLMPIHLICSVIQAANLSRLVLGYSNYNLLRVLLGPILLHGAFDYFLFAIGAIQFAFELDSLALDIISMVIPLLITIAGAIFAYRSYSEVEKRFQDNWRTISTQDDEAGLSLGPGPGNAGL